MLQQTNVVAAAVGRQILEFQICCCALLEQEQTNNNRNKVVVFSYHHHFFGSNETQRISTNIFLSTLVVTQISKMSEEAAAAATTKPSTNEGEQEENDDEEEDLEKLQKEIERMEAEAARITKETDDLEKQKQEAGKTETTSEKSSENKDACSIYVGQVDYSTTPEELLGHFEACGTVERVTIVCDKYTGRPKGEKGKKRRRIGFRNSRKLVSVFSIIFLRRASFSHSIAICLLLFLRTCPQGMLTWNFRYDAIDESN